MKAITKHKSVRTQTERTPPGPSHHRSCGRAESSLDALLKVMAGGGPAEASIVGSDGFASGGELILGTHVSPFEVTCRMNVEALPAAVDDLRAYVQESRVVRDVLRWQANCGTPRGAKATLENQHLRRG
jgi:hypothetical protein